MELRKIIRTGEKEFHVTLKVKDFWKISPLRRKTGVHIHILRKKGPVFWLLAANRHKLILAGLLTMVCVLIFLSGRLWNIHIEGNIMNPTPELLKFLEKRGNPLRDEQKKDPMHQSGRSHAKEISGYYVGVCKAFRNPADL